MMDSFDSTMIWIFGKPPTLDDEIQKMRAKLGETIKDVKKEVRKMGLEKKRLEQQIRVKSQTNPDIAELRILASRYVKQKKQINRQELIIDKIQTFCHMLNDVRIDHQISKSFEGLAACMVKMNQLTDPAKMFAIIKRYDWEKDRFDSNAELINETIEEAYGDKDEDEQDVDEILNQVADELNIIITVEAPEAPKNAKTKAQPNKVNSSSPQQRRGLVKTKGNERKDEDEEEEEEEDEAMNEEDADKILAARLKNLH